MVDELHFSHAAGDVCCERCHVDAAGPTSVSALAYRPPRPSATPKSSAYAELVERVISRLQREGTVFPLVDGTSTMFGYCPACSVGTLTAQVIKADPPRLRLRDCSNGCAPELIAEAMR